MATADTAWTWAWNWWGTLVVLNVIQVFIAFYLFNRSRKSGNHTEDADYLRLMRTMGLIFVCVALYRSIFVSSYLRQLAWFDSVLNSSLLIRSFAVFAELSFAGLIAKSLLRMNKEVPGLVRENEPVISFLQNRAPVILFVCILIANVFATTATITKIDLIFALEETCWGIGFVSIIPMLAISIKRLSFIRKTAQRNEYRLFWIALVVITVYTVGYSLFELGFNLPSVYWPSAIAQLNMPVPDPPFRFGLEAVRDAFFVIHETRDLQAWGGMGFIVWHSGYFTVCVWMVLFLMNGPRRLSASARA